MSYLPEMDGVKIPPPDLRSTEQSSANPLAVLKRRANFARTYIARVKQKSSVKQLCSRYELNCEEKTFAASGRE